MKTLACLVSITLTASLLTSCYLPGYKLKPGDKIGEMTLVGDIPNNLNELCGGFDSLLDGTCEVPASISPLGISTGWQEDTLEALEMAWKDSKWEMSFDGHPVDLSAFETFDMEVGGKKVRVWNIGITNPTPGKHIVQYDFFIDNSIERGNHSVTWTFTIVPAGPTQTP